MDLFTWVALNGLLWPALFGALFTYLTLKFTREALAQGKAEAREAREDAIKRIDDTTAKVFKEIETLKAKLDQIRKELPEFDQEEMTDLLERKMRGVWGAMMKEDKKILKEELAEMSPEDAMNMFPEQAEKFANSSKRASIVDRLLDRGIDMLLPK